MPARGQLTTEGTYITLRGDETVGRETWQLAKLGHSGLLFTSHAEQSLPEPSNWNISYELTQNWVPVLVSIHLNVKDKAIAGEHRIDGARYQVKIEPRGEAPKEATLEFGPQTQVVFISPFSTAVALVRLNLPVGQTRPVQAVVVDSQTLEPRLVAQTYSCTEEDKVTVPAGQFAAGHYVVRTGAEGEAPEAHFWADRNGIVLQYRSPDGSETKLTRYRRIERR